MSNLKEFLQEQARGQRAAAPERDQVRQEWVEAVDRLMSQLEGWLRGHGHRLVASPLDPDAINTLIDCFVLNDESCARNVIDRASRSPTVIYARITVSPSDDGTRDITLVGYWLHKNQMHAVADRRMCEKCSEKQLRGTADELMVSLEHLATPDDPTTDHGPQTSGSGVTAGSEVRGPKSEVRRPKAEV